MLESISVLAPNFRANTANTARIPGSSARDPGYASVLCCGGVHAACSAHGRCTRMVAVPTVAVPTVAGPTVAGPTVALAPRSLAPRSLAPRSLPPRSLPPMSLPRWPHGRCWPHGRWPHGHGPTVTGPTVAAPTVAAPTVVAQRSLTQSLAQSLASWRSLASRRSLPPRSPCPQSTAPRLGLRGGGCRAPHPAQTCRPGERTRRRRWTRCFAGAAGSGRCA